MATIVNTPTTRDNTDSGWGLALGIIIAILLIVLFAVYALPALRSSAPADNGTSINVSLPDGGTGGGSGSPTPSPTTPPSSGGSGGIY